MGDNPRDQANLLKCLDAQIILDEKHFVGNYMDDKNTCFWETIWLTKYTRFVLELSIHG
jgi:hypothetical protein